MPEYAIMADLERCVGCRACELACRNENQLPETMSFIRNVRIGPEVMDGKIVMYFVSLPCMHCGRAPCAEVCPARAIKKRPDGIVILDETKCIGCKYCMWVCPFGAPQFNAQLGRMQKCRLCVQRVEKGLEPACVQGCHVKALKFGTLEQLSEMAKKKAARKAAMFRIPGIMTPT
jgi:DMSO reductase iron-sulfur subunit